MPDQSTGSDSRILKSPWFPRILPFAIFMAFIGFQELVSVLEKYANLPHFDLLPFFLYPMKALSTGAALYFLRSCYTEIRASDLASMRHTLLSIFAGLFVFFIWINLDYSFGGEGKGFDPTLLGSDMARTASIAVRLIGAVLIVPVMEELFWRSFLIRYVIDKDFTGIPIGTFTWASFLISSLLFGLEHHLILAGVVAGIVYNLLLYRTKSIIQCILSHGVTNLCLGIYVLWTGQWRFW